MCSVDESANADPVADVVAVVLAREVDLVDSHVGADARLFEGDIDPCDTEDAAAAGEELALASVELEAGAGVDHGHTLELLGPADAGDDGSVHDRSGVALGRHDYAHRVARMLLHRAELAQLAVGAGPEVLQEVALQEAQDHLGLGVAEAHVEFEHLGAVSREHQAHVQAALEEPTVVAHAVQDGLDDLLADPLDQLGPDSGHGRDRSHAAGVRAGVTVAHALVILGAREEREVHAIAQDVDGHLGPSQELLDDHHLAGVTVDAVDHEVVESRLGLLLAHGNHHALAGRQAVGLDDQTLAVVRVHVRHGFVVVVEGVVLGRGHAVPAHEILGELLGALELGRILARAEDLDASLLERVGHPEHERPFRANHHEIDRFRSGEPHHGRDIGGVLDVQVGDVGHVRESARTRVAWSYEQELAERRLGDRQGQGMLTPTLAEK